MELCSDVGGGTHHLKPMNFWQNVELSLYKEHLFVLVRALERS